MNDRRRPNSNHQSAAESIWYLSREDLPGWVVRIMPGYPSADHATVSLDGRERVGLLQFQKSTRGLVDIIVVRGTVPSATVLLATERTIMAHFAALPAWRDLPCRAPLCSRNPGEAERRPLAPAPLSYFARRATQCRRHRDSEEIFSRPIWFGRTREQRTAFSQSKARPTALALGRK